MLRPPNGFFSTDSKIIPRSLPLTLILSLQFWTATSNERFVYVNRIFAGRSHACLMVFDVTNRRSFDIIPDLIDKVRDIAGVSVVMMLTATKIDLPDRVVTTDEAQLLANRYGLMYAETSSADNEGITEAVDTTIRTVVDKLASGELVVQEYIRLVNKPEPTGSSCCWS